MIGYIHEETETSWDCIGILINEYYVLTVAHCLYIRHNVLPSLVRLGDFGADVKDAIRSQELMIAKTILHPEYSHEAHKNDIALIKLAVPPNLNPYARPACLSANKVSESTKTLVTGRLNQNIKNVKHTHIFKVFAKIAPNEECIEAYSKYFRDDESMLCVGSYRSDKPYQGESGSALVKDSIYCMYEVVGLFAYKAVGGKPDIYTNVTHHLDWIENILWPEEKKEQDIYVGDKIN